jgi:chemotaxis receptor (MCP) glutamine deamidase CheD
MTPSQTTSRTYALLRGGCDKVVTLYLGGVHAGDSAVLIRTLVGSCIAVCVFDPATRVGGMNHFMLPAGGEDGPASEATRFGVYAMDCLIAAVMKAGGDRRRLIAKVFGGAHVLDTPESEQGVPQQNVAFIRKFMESEGIPLAAQDLGGYYPRDVHFFTATGQVFVRRVTNERACKRLIHRERKKEHQAPRYGGVMFFNQE